MGLAISVPKPMALPSWVPQLLPGVWHSFGEVYVGLVTVRPDAAEVLLKDHNSRNRPVIAANVETIKARLADGCFPLTGETGIIDWDGQITDFQHRLIACLETKVPFRTLVTYGVDPAVFDFIDIGSKRTIADGLGRAKETNTRALSSAIITLHGFTIHGRIHYAPVAKNQKLDLLSAREFLDDHSGLRDSVKLTVGTKPVKRLASRVGGPRVLAVFHYAASRVDSEFATDFITRLAEKRFDGDCYHSARLLSLRLDEDLAPEMSAALLIKAWNDARTANKPKLLRWAASSEKYPKIDGWKYDDNGRPIGPDTFEIGG